MKILCTIFIFLLITNNVFALDEISFIYINGSNNNDLKMKNWYMDGVKKLHKELLKNFNKSYNLKIYFPVFQNSAIKKEPLIFFWGYDSRENLNYVKRQNEFRFKAPLAYFAKKFITNNIHDALWIQKPNNMQPIIDDLDRKIKQQNSKCVLFGYSAGAFVTQEYMFNKLKYINVKSLFKNSDIKDFIQKSPIHNTCLSAITQEKFNIGKLNSNGDFVLNTDTDLLKKNYLKLEELTNKYCIQDNKIAGAVHFANPLALFYSDLYDDTYILSKYNRLMTKYILEKGMFIITVNFAEDPLGFSITDNLPVKEIEQKLEMKLTNPKGVIYNNSNVWSKRPFFLAHTSYWSARKIFAKSVVKTLEKGYEFQFQNI